MAVPAHDEIVSVTADHLVITVLTKHIISLGARDDIIIPVTPINKALGVMLANNRIVSAIPERLGKRNADGG